jgi:anti-sigma regulatory factor (Ser/Thr protein kinase)
MGGAPVTERYTRALTADPAEIASVREAVRALAASGGFAGRAGDLELALDELVANAQEHGRPPITVTAWMDGRLVVQVEDRGDGFDYAAQVRRHPPRPYDSRGRGLWIVRQLVDVVSVSSSPSGTTVRIELSDEPHIGA